jgi:hypothetical protein
MWMIVDSNWLTLDHGYDRMFMYTGVHQFILDMHFFLKHADVYLSDDSIQLANDACARAMKLYFKRCVSDELKKRVIKGGEWFELRLNDLAKRMSTNELILKGLS